MSTRSTQPRTRPAILSLVALCLVVGVLLATAGVAAASPSPTELTANAQQSTITWGSHTVLTGTLMDTASLTALGGLWVEVHWSTTGSPSAWCHLSTVTTETEAQYATGQYTQVVQPRRLTYYRFVFLGTAAYAPAVSNTLAIKVRPYLGTPSTARVVKAGRRFSIRGSLKPRFTQGTKTVMLQVYKRIGRRWVVVKRLMATNYNAGSYSKYLAATRLTSRGKYCFRAFTRTTDEWAAATSDYSRTLYVH